MPSGIPCRIGQVFRECRGFTGRRKAFLSSSSLSLEQLQLSLVVKRG